MLDKIFLFIFGVEWFGFGILGLFFPEIISSMIGISQSSDFFLSETRAWYSFFYYPWIDVSNKHLSYKAKKESVFNFWNSNGEFSYWESFKLYTR